MEKGTLADTEFFLPKWQEYRFLDENKLIFFFILIIFPAGGILKGRSSYAFAQAKKDLRSFLPLALR